MSSLSRLVITIIMSATPIIEQKAALPYAVTYGEFTYMQAYIITLIGALIPAPFILKLMPYVLNLLKRIKIIDRVATWYEDKALKKGAKIQNYQLIGLFLFVAIPLPGTGVWTGSTVAALLELDFKKSLLVIMLGAAFCGIEMMFITLGIGSVLFG